jgi:hypothetical protein
MKIRISPDESWGFFVGRKFTAKGAKTHSAYAENKKRGRKVDGILTILTASCALD